MNLFAVYYDEKRLTKPSTEYEARMDLLRLQPVFQNLSVRECRAKAREWASASKIGKSGRSR
ncbi:hypothetical protein D7M11_02480 [Paenibacillus ginsengarvi]|uniref:Uncharacterized protein n=2 Tax=Paenibacillus ginsengarvi TaxID=400777 RepID=A0A3B0CVV2_9BACL|nr:hypothetical protein D7M11_02480 [Paenibacillus ginsengarvi]